jgi:DNA-binding LytR/AlgR family response regulator
MLRTIAIDDEPPALTVISAFCNKVDFIQLEKTFTNTDEAKRYLTTNEVDLILIDINMPAVSGIDFYKSLVKKPMLIFTTAYSEFAIEGFNLSAVDYLLKPFTFGRFLQAIEKARSLQRMIAGESSIKDKFITLRINYALTKISVDDILFIEGLDDYLKIHLKDSKPIVARLTMKAIMDKLPDEAFVRVHRSFIVSLKHVESVRNKVISIAGEEIPVSNSYEPHFLSVFKG